ncbi:GDP-mannose 4,6-dehydratase [Candidatus Sumerlaeota bacterium]|nr:GDP-mannose 4,6-dehydratase [Candidatus Sumerlaeota bacterium]
MTHTLITGGCGFIGSHLAEALLARGHRVTVIDDLSTGAIENIASFRGHDRFSHHIDTVLNRPLMAELVDAADEVYHLAAAVGVRLIVERPVATIETNIKGTEVVLELASKKGKRVLIASSSEVYGKGARVPMAEGDDCVLGPSVSPRWSYACSKLIDEFLALAHHGERDLPTLVARFFNTVGPRQTGAYGMVIPRMVDSALAGEPIVVHGDGEQTRTFCHVADVVEAIIALMATPSAMGRVFNVGGVEEISIVDLARLVKKVAGSRSEIRHVSHREVFGEGFEDLRRRVPDITRLRETIDWQPRHTLRQIVEDVVASRRGEGG